MRKLKYMAGVVIAAMAISSCDEDTIGIGNSLTNENDRIDVQTSVYHASTRTVIADSVYSLSTNIYLGRVQDPETLSEVKSEFSTQFHLLESFYISPEEYIVKRTSNNRAAADSCDIVLYLTSPFKTVDTLSAMKLRIREMSSPVESSSKYYTNFDPEKQGLIRADGINRGKMFTYRNLTDTYTERTAKNYLNNVRISLNEPYTDKNGTTYSNYGTYILQQFYDHPEYFKNSYTFTHNVCPGFFFEITDGLGLHAKVSNIGLRVYYDVQTPDTAYRAAFVLAGTKEVLQTNKVTNDKESIERLAKINDYTFLKTPAGLYTEVTLPVDEIKLGHEGDSLLAAKITFQRENYQSTEVRMLGIPQNILMVKKDSLTSYFEKLNVPDSKTSYFTNYNSSYNTYTFTNISNLITEMWNTKKKGMTQNPNWTTEHPNWNKVLLVPITYTTSSTSTTPTRVEHDMSLTSTRLVGGANMPIDLNVVYAKFH